MAAKAPTICAFASLAAETGFGRTGAGALPAITGTRRLEDEAAQIGILGQLANLFAHIGAVDPNRLAAAVGG